MTPAAIDSGGKTRSGLKLLALSLLTLIQGRFLWTLWDGRVNDGELAISPFGKMLGLFSFVLCAVTGAAGLYYCYLGGKSGWRDMFRFRR